jgi:hypothetical protein
MTTKTYLHHDNTITTERDIEIARNEFLWVRRCQICAVLLSAVWIAWVLVIQVFMTDSFPSSWFVRSSDSTNEATGW